MLLEQLREILNSLYVKYGLTSEAVRLSEVIDELINKEMGEQIMTCRRKTCNERQLIDLINKTFAILSIDFRSAVNWIGL